MSRFFFNGIPEVPFPAILTPSQSQVGNLIESSVFHCNGGLTSNSKSLESHKSKCRFKIASASNTPEINTK